MPGQHHEREYGALKVTFDELYCLDEGSSSTMYLNTSKDKRQWSDTVRLSPIEMPKFHCFTDMGLGEKPLDPEEVLRIFDKKKREAERKAHKIKVDKMFKLAMANSASAQRILSKHTGETGLDIEGTDPSRIADMTWTLVPLKDANNTKGADGPESSKPWLKHLRSRAIVPIPEVSEGDMEENVKILPKSRPQSKKSTHSAPKKKSLPLIQPLSINHILQRERTIVARGPSTHWVNYV